ncbi:VOC family protein [Caulobacter vibrioides]|uniref:Bleomycin resistance protein n=1 Tax=Caulobacter vibrioides TaxID=155892 RepID=A0A290MGQ7_CAUVI|nr:VOC family protein [Caulobacter vibrioides]ATC31000.1 VOC family protein [Caulobacter vibrioides]
MSNFIQVTPFLHVRDLDEALSFFVDLLGFGVPYREPGYAYVHRETVGFRLLEAEEAVIKPRGVGGFAYYIDVRDVDAVAAELAPRLAALPPEDVCGPVDQPYGQREFMIRAPDGGLLVFGQAIEK